MEGGKDKGKILTDSYLLSPKDLFTLNNINDIARISHSLKIEGRMKSPEYVYYVTKAYREALDAYYNNKDYKVTEELVEKLQVLYSRGSSDGYFYGYDSNNLMNTMRPNHQGISVGKVV